MAEQWFLVFGQLALGHYDLVGVPVCHWSRRVRDSPEHDRHVPVHRMMFKPQ